LHTFGKYGGYLLQSVGALACKTNKSHRAGALKALKFLHNSDNFHGDARLANIVIVDESKFLWIDPLNLTSKDHQFNMKRDLSLLVASMCDKKDFQANDIPLDYCDYEEVYGGSVKTFK
jgi:tRNA A-37 threonylcarbamoyl transferase component Bud32